MAVRAGRGLGERHEHVPDPVPMFLWVLDRPEAVDDFLLVRGQRRAWMFEAALTVEPFYCNAQRHGVFAALVHAGQGAAPVAAYHAAADLDAVLCGKPPRELFLLQWCIRISVPHGLIEPPPEGPGSWDSAVTCGCHNAGFSTVIAVTCGS